jgi:putative transcription antitermination factor YqgF
MGVDLGRLRIGIAIGEAEFAVATPRPPLDATGALATDAIEIDALAKKEGVERIVVGQPLNEEDSRMARVCGMLADHLRTHGWQVDLVDESFTSIQADERMVELKGSQRRKRKDSEAAAIILERFFHEQARA